MVIFTLKKIIRCFSFYWINIIIFSTSQMLSTWLVRNGLDKLSEFINPDMVRRSRSCSGVNFTNIPRAAFSHTKTDNFTVFIALLGSPHVKAAHRILVKLTPVHRKTLLRWWCNSKRLHKSGHGLRFQNWSLEIFWSIDNYLELCFFFFCF